MGAWRAPAASVRLMIWMPPPGASMTISVWTVPAVSVTGRLVVLVGPVALMVQVPDGIGTWGLTLPGAASVVMLPGAPAAQLQWNVTFCWLMAAWITRTKDLPFGAVRLLSMILSWPCWALVLSGTRVYVPPAFTVRLTDHTGLLDAGDPAARILTL